MLEKSPESYVDFLRTYESRYQSPLRLKEPKQVAVLIQAEREGVEPGFQLPETDSKPRSIPTHSIPVDQGAFMRGMSYFSEFFRNTTTSWKDAEDGDLGHRNWRQIRAG